MDDQNSEHDRPRDLLGDPVDLRHDNIGAPPFEITEEKQLLVATLAAAKWTQERIARYLGCDPKTLRKHFSRELDQAADLIEGKAIEHLLANLGKGSIGAVRKVLEISKDGRALPPAPKSAEGAKAEVEAEAEAAPLGKKAQMAEAAKNPTAGWGELLNTPGGRAN